MPSTMGVAGVAQLVERRIRDPMVQGSEVRTPPASGAQEKKLGVFPSQTMCAASLVVGVSMQPLVCIRTHV